MAGTNDNLRLEIFIHMDAVPRDQWTSPDMDARPLSELGQKQADRMAEVVLDEGPIDAIISSPAVRATQSLEPLSKRTGLPVVVTPGFGDTFRYRAPEGWDNPDSPGPSPLGGAYSAGKALSELRTLLANPDVNRAVLSSYDDIVPAFLAALAGIYGTEMPKQSRSKGYRYVVEISGEKATLSSKPAPDDFPT